MTEDERDSAPEADEATEAAAADEADAAYEAMPPKASDTAFEEFAASWVPPWARSQPELVIEPAADYTPAERGVGRLAYAVPEDLPNPDDFEAGLGDEQSGRSLEAILLVVDEPDKNIRGSIGQRNRMGSVFRLAEYGDQRCRAPRARLQRCGRHGTAD